MWNFFEHFLPRTKHIKYKNACLALLGVFKNCYRTQCVELCADALLCAKLTFLGFQMKHDIDMAQN